MALADERCGPRTYVGLWLAADALDRRDDRSRRSGDLRRTGGWTTGRHAVVENAFSLAVIHHFNHSLVLSDMRDFILAAMENYNHSPHLRFLEIEWKIRRALGQVVPIEVIDVSRSRLVSRLLVGYISDLNGLSPSAVELLIAKAEGLTVADRYEPLTALEHDETGVVIEGVTLSDR